MKPERRKRGKGILGIPEYNKQPGGRSARRAPSRVVACSDQEDSKWREDAKHSGERRAARRARSGPDDIGCDRAAVAIREGAEHPAGRTVYK